MGTNKISFSFIISLSTYLFSQFFLFESQYIPDGTSCVETLGFEPGTPIRVECDGGRLVITRADEVRV